MDHLQEALDLVHLAIANTQPESDLQQKLAAAQRELVESIWMDVVRPSRLSLPPR